MPKPDKKNDYRFPANGQNKTHYQRVWNAIGIGVFGILITLFAWRFESRLPKNNNGESEQWAGLSYRDVIYFPARAVWDGKNPYDSRRELDSNYMNHYPVVDHLPLYSPVLFVIFAPLILLPVDWSALMFFAFSIAAFLALVRLAFYAIKIKPSIFEWLMVTSFLVISQVGRSALNAGQLSAFLALSILGLFVLGNRKKALSSGLYICAMAKPTFGGPIALMMTAAGFWRSSLIGLLVGGTSFVLSMIVVFAMCDSLSYDSVKDVVWGNVNHFKDVTNTGVIFHRIDVASCAEYALGRELEGTTAIAITIFMIGIACCLLHLHQRRNRKLTFATSDADSMENSFAGSYSGALIVVTMYISYFHNVYDLLLLIVPILALWHPEKTEFRFLDRKLRYLLIGLLLVPFLNIFYTARFGKLVETVFSFETADSINLPRYAAIVNGSSLLIVWLCIAGIIVFANFGPRKLNAGVR